jgi:hypothetical protein
MLALEDHAAAKREAGLRDEGDVEDVFAVDGDLSGRPETVGAVMTILNPPGEGSLSPSSV